MNRASLAVGMAVMEMCWLFAWSALFGQWLHTDRPLLGPGSVAVVAIGGALATLGTVRVAGARRAGQWLLVGLGLVLVLAVVGVNHYASTPWPQWLGALWTAMATAIGQFTPPAAAVALGLFIWYRGVRIGSGAPTFGDVDEAFRWGIAALVGFAILTAVGVGGPARAQLQAVVAPFVVGYFFSSLLTLALARLESLRSHTRTLAINTQWLGVLIGVAGLLVLAALAVAQVVSFDLLVVATRPLFDLLGRIVILLIYALVIPLAWVIEWFVFLLLRLLRIDENAQPPEPPQPSDVDAFIQQLLAQLFPPEALAALKAVGVLIVLGVALLVIARTVARWRPRRLSEDVVEEERDTLLRGRSLRALLLAWLRGLFRRQQPVPSGVPVPPLSHHGSTDASLDAGVRALYRRVLQLGDEAGAPRAAATTPREHLPSLAGALEPPDDLVDLTAAYEQVRYAELEPLETEVDALQQRLERIHAREDET
jgi:hypothetical protein